MSDENERAHYPPAAYLKEWASEGGQSRQRVDLKPDLDAWMPAATLVTPLYACPAPAGGWRPSREEVIERICIGLFADYDDLTLECAEDNWRRGFAYGAVGSDGHAEITQTARRVAESLALGAVPEGGEERNSASVDESGGSPPAAAKSDSQHSAGWRSVGSIEQPPMTERGLHGQIMDAGWPEFGGNHQIVEFWEDISLGVHFALTCLCDWGFLTFPAKNSALSPSANGASAGNSGLDEPLPPALPYSAASRP